MVCCAALPSLLRCVRYCHTSCYAESGTDLHILLPGSGPSPAVAAAHRGAARQGRRRQVSGMPRRLNTVTLECAAAGADVVDPGRESFNVAGDARDGRLLLPQGAGLCRGERIREFKD
eukprot:3929167-Rhodomonas_salina.7